MEHAASPNRSVNDITARTSRMTGDREWKFWPIATEPPGIRSRSASTTLLCWPEGFRRTIGSTNELEWHPHHEEVFLLRGRLRFQNGPVLTALSYFNHPAFWTHATSQTTEGEVTLLVHGSHHPGTGLEPVPRGWDGRGYFSSSLLPGVRAVDGLDIDTSPGAWVPVQTGAGDQTGYEAIHVWNDPEDGWSTWLMKIPPNWRGVETGPSAPGSDEVFLISGDLILDRGDDPLRMASQSHFCDPTEFVPYGRSCSSLLGGLALRWTRNGDLVLPPPLVPAAVE